MSVADKALNSLSALPFHDVIAGPLNACVEAQSQAAMSTVNFIKEVGMTTTTDEESGVDTVEAIYVIFSYIQGGRKVNVSVPLLAIVPIPYIAINTIDISFKAQITGTDSTSKSTEDSYQEDTQKKSNKKRGWFSRKTSSMQTNISSKRDSKATKDSTYSIEATIDVNVHASQDSMPAGMAKVLELLNAAVDTCNPDGELVVSDSNLYLTEGEKAFVTISYKGPDGLLKPEDIEIKPAAAKGDVKTQNGMIFLTVTGKKSDATLNVTVKDNDKVGETITVNAIGEQKTEPVK